MDKLVTYTYSNKSKEALTKLFLEFSKLFPCVEKDVTKLFNVGVFMDKNLYANNYLINSLDHNVLDNLPAELTAPCQTPQNRIDFVADTIDKVLNGEIEKPHWMNYLEENLNCGAYALPPSTFLYLKPTNEKYATLADALVKYLYSTDHITEKTE